MRHSALLCWSERWRYPHPWGLVYKHCIPVNHYQYRSPQQMAKRFATRQQAKAEGCGSFHHEQGTNWQDYLLTNKQLQEQQVLSHIEEAFAASPIVLYQRRNTIKLVGEDILVKAFHKPRFPNSLIYGLFRKSKAERSYLYAKRLVDLTPEPLTYREHRRWGLLRDSYYACRLSQLPFTFRQVERDKAFPHREQIIRGVGAFMAKLHALGAYPLDFSGGNILLNTDGSQMQLVDLNRMRWYKHISLRKGLRQTWRLVLTDEERQLLNESYIAARQQ